MNQELETYRSSAIRDSRADRRPHISYHLLEVLDGPHAGKFFTEQVFDGRPYFMAPRLGECRTIDVYKGGRLL